MIPENVEEGFVIGFTKYRFFITKFCIIWLLSAIVWIRAHLFPGFQNEQFLISIFSYKGQEVEPL